MISLFGKFLFAYIFYFCCFEDYISKINILIKEVLYQFQVTNLKSSIIEELDFNDLKYLNKLLISENTKRINCILCNYHKQKAISNCTCDDVKYCAECFIKVKNYKCPVCQSNIRQHDYGI